MRNSDIYIASEGVISALGRGVGNTLRSFDAAAVPGLPALFETSLKKPVFEVCEQFSNDYMRTVSLAFAAVEETLNGIDISGMRVGVCMGTTVAAQLNDLDFYVKYRNTGDIDQNAVRKYLASNLAHAVAERFSLSDGPRLTVVNACSSGTDAIGIAMSWLRADMCDAVIAGGADELNKVPYLGFNSLSVYSDDAPRPFDALRAGLNLGEAAGAVLLAKKDLSGNGIYCAGYGTYSDAYHLTAPRPDGSGLETAIRKALAESEIEPQQIGFVNAHGTATVNNDLVEGNTLARVFGSDLKFYSSKGYTGHTLGAAGAIEAVFCALALREGWIPACSGFKYKDDNIAIAPVAERTKVDARYAMSTSLAFGGNNSALVFGRM